MSSKDKLVLLADNLDKKGLVAEAAVVDEFIAKRTFDEETRGDIDSVIAMINQYAGELIKAAHTLKSDQAENFFTDKLARINEAASWLRDLNALAAEEKTAHVASEELSTEEGISLLGEDGSTNKGGKELNNWWDNLS
jgi:hypothetical protein